MIDTIEGMQGEGRAAGPSFSPEGLHLPAALIIMDGFGLAPAGEGNAIARAHTPNLDRLFAEGSFTRIAASAQAVGLPEGQMGNSEVGHLNIGAGRVVHQELSRINLACEDGSLRENAALRSAFARAAERGGAVHFMGLLSDGGVHSSNAHLYALLEMAKACGVGRVLVHCFMDGRDVPPTSGAGYVAELEERLGALSDAGFSASIASIEGRYYAMDRDRRWERVERAYDAIVRCAPRTALSPAGFVAASYERGVTDEFIEPGSFVDAPLTSDDSVVFFNFRPDRARQLTYAFVQEGFEGFATEPIEPAFVCLTEYDAQLTVPIAFPKTFPENVLADVLAAAGLRQLHIAETEKYAHVTFFLNGGVEEPKAGEQRILVPSPKVATYDLQPAMSAPEVADRLVEAIEGDAADVFLVNFANCDMVGHTGSIPAAIAAVEAVDAALGRVLEALGRRGGFALVTADHGNADRMLADDGSPFTAHTTNLVPLALFDPTGRAGRFAQNLPGSKVLEERDPEGFGALCDLAPTLLSLIGIERPAEMTGRVLVEKA